MIQQILYGGRDKAVQCDAGGERKYEWNEAVKNLINRLLTHIEERPTYLVK